MSFPRRPVVPSSRPFRFPCALLQSIFPNSVMADARIEEIRKLLPQAMLPDWVRLGSRLVRLLRDNHHPDTHDAILARLLNQARASVELRQRRQTQVPQVSYPASLPIAVRKDEIVAAIRDSQVVVIAG